MLFAFSAAADSLPLKTYPSLFFKDGEIDRLSEETQDPLAGWPPSVSAILYCDEAHWSVWINNTVIHRENAHEWEGVHIDKVTPHEVTVSHLSPTGETLETLTLRPSSLVIPAKAGMTSGGEDDTQE